MKKNFDKKHLILAMFILLFAIGLTGCEERFEWADGSLDKCELRENVVVKNDNDTMVYNGYNKPRYLYVKDLEDNTTRRVEYFTDFYSFAMPGDTVTLKMPHTFFKEKYQSENYKHNESNLVELRKVDFIYFGWEAEKLDGQTYIQDTYGMIESHQTAYYAQKREEERAIKAMSDSIKYARNRAVDSLRIEFANMSKTDRQHAEKTILYSDNEILKQALNIIKAEEHDKYVADSTRSAIEHAEREMLLKQQRLNREKNRAIIQHKRKGTLWQYIDSENVTIRDTVTVVRVYNEMQLNGGLNGVFNSSSQTQPINGVGARGFWKFGSGRAHISGGGGTSSANGGLSGNINYSGHGAVVARDKYGYQYTFSADPMMQVKTGDKIVLDYYGRIHTNDGYIDRVKLLNIKYR